MGLAPVWRLRDVAQEAAGAPDAVTAADLPGPSGTNHESCTTSHALPVTPHQSRLISHESRVTTQASRPSTGDGRRETIMCMDWEALKQRVAACTDCPLHQKRNKTVFGVGDESADWMFIGEGPGAEEDAKGEPFVGQAGRLLDNMLAAIGLKRGQDVYIANIVKCRPPGNRVPERAE